MQTEANMQVHLLISARFYASFGGTVNKLYCFHGRFGCNFHLSVWNQDSSKVYNCLHRVVALIQNGTRSELFGGTCKNFPLKSLFQFFCTMLRRFWTCATTLLCYLHQSKPKLGDIDIQLAVGRLQSQDTTFRHQHQLSQIFVKYRH